MSLRYEVRPIKNPKDPSASPKYYLTAKTFAPIDRKFLIKDMVNHTSLTQQEASAGIDYLFEAIPKYISLGFTVLIGEMGHFRIAIKSEGSDTAEEATVEKIKSKRLVFFCGKEVRRQIRECQVEKYSKNQ